MCVQRAITILDLERSLLHCLRRRFRSGVEKDLSSEGEWDPESEQKKDIRRCFRWLKAIYFVKFGFSVSVASCGIYGTILTIVHAHTFQNCIGHEKRMTPQC